MRPIGRTDHIDGKERRFYSVRLILLCVTVSVLAAALTCVVVVIAITGRQNTLSYDQDYASCVRQNQTRHESNLRIPQHTQDARNLARLATTLSHTREREAVVFTRIGKAFGIEAQVKPLVVTLRGASALDKRIANEQARVSFERLHIFDCSDPNVVRRG